MLTISTVLLAADAAYAEPASEIRGESQLVHSRCVELLREQINSAEFWPAMHAAEALTQSGQGEFVQKAVRPRLSTVSDARQRCGVARELARSGDDKHVQILWDTLASSDPYAHVHACESLYKIRQVGDGVLLRNAMQDQASPIKALMAAGALARSGDEPAMSFIRSELERPDSGHCWVAAWLLGKIGSEQDLPALRSGLAHQKTPRDQAYFQHALALLGDPEGQQALIQNLQQEDSIIRADAAYMAGDAGMDDAKPALIRLLDDANLDVTIRAAQGLLALETSQSQKDQKEAVAAKAQNPARLSPETVLTLAPGVGNSRNSEGDFIQTTDGRLLFIYSHFGQGHGGDHDTAELRERVSLDGGQTWGTEERTVLKPASGLNVMSVSLLRLQTGEIALFYLAKVSLSDCRPEMRISKDEGKTWSDPVQCIQDEVDYYVLNNNRAIQLKSGRLILPVCRHRGLEGTKRDWQGQLMCYLSDDQGKTWRRSESTLIGQTPTGSRLTVQEPGVIELKDGRMMMFIRSNSGSQMVSFSSDEGVTWTQPETSNMTSPLSPASMARIPQTGDLLLVWNNYRATDDPKPRRSPLTVAISKDEGKSWEHVKDLETDPNGWYCYTAIEFVGDTVLLGHCAGDRRGNGLVTTEVTRFGLDWLYDK